jgi:hypothetical protein
MGKRGEIKTSANIGMAGKEMRRAKRKEKKIHQRRQAYRDIYRDYASDLPCHSA